MAISNTLLQTTETTLLSASSETAVLCLVFCNNDTSSRTITVYAYPSTGSGMVNTSTIVNSYTIPTLDTFIWDGNEKFILDTGGKVTATSDVANKVSVATSYKVV